MLNNCSNIKVKPHCQNIVAPSISTAKDSNTIFEPSSTAVYVTIVTPIGNVSPETWLDVRVTEPELSLAIGCVQSTTAVGSSGSVSWVMFAGVPVMTGYSLSIDKDDYIRIKDTKRYYLSENSPNSFMKHKYTECLIVVKILK